MWRFPVLCIDEVAECFRHAGATGSTAFRTGLQWRCGNWNVQRDTQHSEARNLKLSKAFQVGVTSPGDGAARPSIVKSCLCPEVGFNAWN